jgi:hypothetical protein
MTTNNTGRKNRIIGTVSFGGGSLLFGFRHAHVAVFLRQHPHRGAERRAVTLRLLQGETDRLHTFQANPLRKIVVSCRRSGKYDSSAVVSVNSSASSTDCEPTSSLTF